MAQDITLPAVGESITEGVLSRWIASDGSYVKEGEPIYELETDKISTEVAAEVGGVITHKANEGDTIEVGAVVAAIDTDAEAPAADASGEPEVNAGAERDDIDETSALHKKQKIEARVAEAEQDDEAPGMSPAVRRLVEEHQLNPREISGSGKDGRITKGDVLAHIEAQSPSSTESKRDSKALEPAPAKASKPASAAKPAPAMSSPGARRTAMSSLRKRIAQRLVNAQRTAAILTTFNEIDMSHCMALRNRHKQRFEEVHGTRLGFMSFFTRAVVEALQKYPLINAQIDGDDIVEYEHINVGVAVGTEKGLVVPVLKEAENMSFADIERGIREFAKKARDGKLTIPDMQGGTFTISNGGTYGSLLSTPIINPPQSGILGMHAIQERPIAVNGEVVIRPMMYVALSYDHRIVDGAEAVGFLVRVKELVEDPERMLLDL